MAQTVIGVFDYDVEAQNAYQQLLNNGFSRSNVDMAAQVENNNTAGSAYRDRDNDSFGNFFSSLFGSSDESRDYTEVARRGAVVTVHAQTREEAERAATILDQYGAVDVNERAAQYRSGADLDTIRSTDRAATSTGDSVNVIEEEMQVGKRVVETGGIRLRSRIIERPVEEHLRLRVEHVHVERNPVNRPATDADLAGFREGTIEVTEHAEVPIVNKEARVVEEIHLEKDVEERDEVIRDTVRSTDVDVENLNTDQTRGYDSDLDRNRGYDADDDARSRPGTL